MSVCRLYFQNAAASQKGHPELPPARTDGDAAGSAAVDQRLGHCLTLTQLGKWQAAATSLCELNKFFQEQYEQAARAAVNSGVPPDHVDGKGQLVLEEWIHCMKQLNRCAQLVLLSSCSRTLVVRQRMCLSFVCSMSCPKVGTDACALRRCA